VEAYDYLRNAFARLLSVITEAEAAERRTEQREFIVPGLGAGTAALPTTWAACWTSAHASGLAICTCSSGRACEKDEGSGEQTNARIGGFSAGLRRATGRIVGMNLGRWKGRISPRGSSA
jgi:hypothetical protein